MCTKGLTQHSSRTTGPASNLPEPPAIPGVTADECRTIVEMLADGTDVGTKLAGHGGPRQDRRAGGNVVA